MFILSRSVNLRKRLLLSLWQRTCYATFDCEIEYLCYFSVSNIVSASQLMFIQGVLLTRDRSIHVSNHRVILW